MKKLLTLLFIGIASLYAQNVPSYVPTDSLVGWWPFNGSANDESGNGNNGLVYGATQSQGIRGQSDHSYFFNGSSYIQIPSNPVFNFSGSHTISIWAKVVGTNTYQHFITRNEGSSFPIIEQFNLRRSTNAGFEAFTSPRGNQFYNQPIFSTSSSNWNHCLVVVDVAVGNSYVYINGSLVSTTNLVLPYNYRHNNGNIWIGVENPIAQLPSGPLYLTGFIDEVGIWNRALTQQEILALYFGCNDSLQLQPQNFTAYTGTGWANFKCRSTDTATSYQWQQNIVSGWSNLSNFGNYSGATSDSLVIIGVTSAMNNYGYRCIVTGCTTDTSDVAILTVVNGIGLGESTLEKLTIAPNPTNGLVSLNISVVGNYELLTLDGRVLESGTAKKDYDLTTYPKGVYHLRLSTDEGTRVLKVVKN